VVVGSVPDYFVGWVFVVPVQRIVRVLELAGAVMEELGNSQGPRTDAVGAHCREFMLAMKVTSLLRALAACLPISLSFPLLRLNPR
jgi:mediator of RNA polymerase II transcription subunit 11